MERKKTFPEQAALSEKQPVRKDEEADFAAERQKLRVLHGKSRDQMSAGETGEKSRRICRQLLMSDWYTDCSVIYGYYSLGNEVDCRPFLEQALLDGKMVTLPRTGERGTYQMEFYQVSSLTQVAEGNFHVMEPLRAQPLVQKGDAVVLVPGLVFDQSGNRYGYGSGYYDRYFSRFPGLRRMGLAYECQMEDIIPILDTDVKMERIYTEEAVYTPFCAIQTERQGVWCGK